MQAQNSVTLRIKKTYFDRILRGEKTVEYRDAKPFYDRLFSGRRVKTLILHYQSSRQLAVDVVSVRKVRTPKRLKESAIPFGSKVYAIKLGRSRLLKRGA